MLIVNTSGTLKVQAYMYMYMMSYVVNCTEQNIVFVVVFVHSLCMCPSHLHLYSYTECVCVLTLSADVHVICLPLVELYKSWLSCAD